MSSLPALTSISNGTPADATEVDTNFDTIAAFVDTELINRDGSIVMTGALDLGSNKITSLATPTTNTDAATKAYADSLNTPSTGSLDSGNLRYAKQGGIVHVWTTAEGGTVGGTLPVGFRPATTVRAVGISTSEYIEVVINTAGVVSSTTPAADPTTFSVSFAAA